MLIPHPFLSNYRLLTCLGRGGMGDVYLGVSTGPGGFVGLLVLKVLRAGNEPENVDLVKMFEAEGRIAGRLRHPNIVQTYAVGVDGEQHFIVMEYLEGQPLSRLQGRSGSERCSLELQIAVLCQILEGLEYTHTVEDFDGTPLHLVHRDVSPQNIFVTYTGDAKLLDFGIAKTSSVPHTRAGIIKGKPAYMSPEQASGGALDHRSDLFSVGVILWEAIAGRRMYPKGTEAEIMDGIAQGSIPGIRAAVPDVPVALEHVVARSLAVDREERYPDAKSFREALMAAVDGPLIGARDIGRRVESLFRSDQERLQRIIRDALRDSADSEESESFADSDSDSELSGATPPNTGTPFAATPLVANPLVANPLFATHPSELRSAETPVGVSTQPIERPMLRPIAPAGGARKRIPAWALALAIGVLGSALSLLAVLRYRSAPQPLASFTQASISQPSVTKGGLPAASGIQVALDPVQGASVENPRANSGRTTQGPALSTTSPNPPTPSAVSARTGEAPRKTQDANATQSSHSQGTGSKSEKGRAKEPVFIKVW